MNRNRILRNPWLYAIPAGVLNLAAQDVISQTLTKIDTSMVTWANILVVVGLMILGAKYIFADRHDHSSTWSTILGAIILLGARAIATFFLPTPGA